ncbi:Cytochrome c biogenesis protein CcsA [Rosistilla ulvae]|uniref:Cytochrome c biogenesis protein CcsA n=1 Tax=Rosistilla ulvae TaxID=1930277 RepID=A0A517M0L3_9BACT|nr:cytochrome c biogenesis protein CcsA [Rosistilla ulvae]QDS88369.1 Cytochrome c biogenesis protein CcsA [Rosistilla ulvae]
MATVTADRKRDSELGINAMAMSVLSFLGSLKWTVALFALSIVIILAGTLAQDEMNMQQVKDAYFTSWVSRVYIDDFVPQPFYFHQHRIGANTLMPDGAWFPFPGGKLIGLALLINLIAAKITRFHIRATGTRLIAGTAVCAVGLGVLLAIVFGASNAEGLQGQPPSYPMVWYGLCAMVFMALAGSIAGIVSAPRRGWKYAFGTLAVLFGAGAIAILAGFTIGEPGLRIVWQMAKGLGVASILLVGCLLLFGQQGGNLLLHFGVALLMIGQFAFGDRQLEQRLILSQRESSNTLINMDQVELAFMDKSKEGETQVIAIPDSMLAAYEGSDSRISDPRLPFEIEVVDYMPNSQVADEGENPADTGLGQRLAVKEAAPVGGASEGTNIVSAYVRFYAKGETEPLGTFLVSQYLNDAEKLFSGSSFKDSFDILEANDKEFAVGLRYARVPKPYWIQLSEVRRVNYSGTETPRDYSSFIRIVDTETGEDRKERIWMNNPLRYRGETFYQSQYLESPGGTKATVLQVVRNEGWLIPYVACGIVGLGMMVHFIGTLDRFVGRREREEKKLPKPEKTGSRWPIVATVAVVAFYQISMLIPPTFWKDMSSSEQRAKEMDLYRAGEIPVMSGGRVLPLDQFAREAMKVVSNKDSLPTSKAPQALIDRVGKKLTAMEWFFESIGDGDDIMDFPMVRIDATEVLSEVGLSERTEKRYSFRELQPSFAKIEKIAKATREKEAQELSFKENAIMQLYRRLNHFLMIKQVFREPLRVDDLSESEIPEGMSLRDLREAVLRVNTMQVREVLQVGGPAIFPPQEDTETQIEGTQPEWKMYAPAALEAYAAELDGADAEIPGLAGFNAMRAGYGAEDPTAFNDGLDSVLSAVAAANPSNMQPWRVQLERWLVGTHSSVAAFTVYVLALLISLYCLMIKSPRAQKTAFYLIGCSLALHTLILVVRMMITGRAPVINLYSSAVFISWAGVLFGMGLERIYRHGIGNVVAAMCGVFGLLVAYSLNSGDTMPVLQAVLDTQFWLATHVVTITLGYTATFLAGIMGILYLFFSKRISPKLFSYRRDLYRMIYGVCCFGILFSFIGTVLGGLWADDSWGRFWGWDPKENGALLIVIWNALMLHARWDGMVGERGFATLAVAGNIITAWSWFGTNQLGFGLHSYGGQDSVKMALLAFVVSQFAIIGIGIAGSLYSGRDSKGAV